MHSPNCPENASVISGRCNQCGMVNDSRDNLPVSAFRSTLIADASPKPLGGLIIKKI